MADIYEQLVEATMGELQRMKTQGQRHVSISPDSLAWVMSLRRPSPTGTKRSAAAASAARPRAATPARVQATAPTVLAAPAPPPALVVADRPVVAPSLKDQTAVEEVMQELRTRALACQKCPHLAKSRKHVVFGVGDIHAPLMFVGEAPGADEDEQGEPFVGKAGQLLTKIIQTMGFTRQTVYIANILKCRPDTPGQTAGNRKPTPEEMQTCLPYLTAQIDAIKPKVIVALGATAVEGLLGKTIGITKLRGHFRDFRGTPLMPTYHPAYLLRNQALSVKREVWEDMLLVLEKLGAPISEKQRNYFLAKA
jgi:uracil-DNA glycosylase family 4